MSAIERIPWGISSVIREKVIGDGSDVGAGGVLWPNTKEGALNPEKYTIRKIRGIQEISDPTLNSDLGYVLGWLRDQNTIKNLRAPITPTKSLSDKAINEEKIELDKYFHNGTGRDEEGNIIPDDPRKMTPIFAVNGLDEVIGMSVIRWKGNPLTKEGETPSKIASIEMVIVDPSLQHKHVGVGVELMTATLETVFNQGYAPYNGDPAEAVRLWVFTDRGQDDYSFYRQFGFGHVMGEVATWPEYCEARGLQPDGRDGQWLELKRDIWEKFKKMDAEKDHPKFKFDPDIIDKATLRSPIPVRARSRLKTPKN